VAIYKNSVHTHFFFLLVCCHLCWSSAVNWKHTIRISWYYKIGAKVCKFLDVIHESLPSTCYNPVYLKTAWFNSDSGISHMESIILRTCTTFHRQDWSPILKTQCYILLSWAWEDNMAPFIHLTTARNFPPFWLHVHKTMFHKAKYACSVTKQKIKNPKLQPSQSQTSVFYSSLKYEKPKSTKITPKSYILHFSCQYENITWIH